jgi:hypothetical protein
MNLSTWTERDEFDWDADSTIIAEQPTTAVYWNQLDQVVIRQQQWAYEDEDQFVFFSIEMAPMLIRALQQKLVEFASAEEEFQVGREPANRSKRPLSGAERQRRYKKRQLNNDSGDKSPSPCSSPGDETASPGDVTGYDVPSLFPSPG